MTWSEFKEQVRVHLVAYNKTHGAQTLIETLIKGGVEDLQSSVKALRARTATLPVSAITADGGAGYFDIPPGAFISGLFARSTTDESINRPYERISDEAIEDMRQENLPEGSRAYAYQAYLGRVYVFPLPVSEEAEVAVTYSVISANFEDTDDTTLGNGEAEAVGNYCLAQLSLKLDHDAGLSAVYQGLFRSLKRQIMSDRNEAHVTAP